jgi:MFS family permease
MLDRTRITAGAAVRSAIAGCTGVLLGTYAASAGLPPLITGLLIAAGLAGAALASALVAWRGDAWGRRRTVAVLALLSAIGGVALAAASPTWHGALIAASFLGMLNGMGRDRSAALNLDQAMLPTTTDDSNRTKAFAWYSMVQDVAGGIGALGAALPALIVLGTGLAEVDVLRGMLASLALLGLAGIPLALRLSPAVEAPLVRPPMTPAGRRTITRLSGLFALDSIGGGMLTAAGISFILATRFDAGPIFLGVLFASAKILNALSHLGAAWLAKRIGLVNTMIFTHLPSSLLLATVAFAPNLWVAAILFLLREGLVEMDVPTRSSYVMAVVAPHERTAAAGITGIVRVGGWAIGAAIAGPLMAGTAVVAPLVVGAGTKIVYDLLLWRAFRHVRPPEEEASLRKS